MSFAFPLDFGPHSSLLSGTIWPTTLLPATGAPLCLIQHPFLPPVFLPGGPAHFKHWSSLLQPPWSQCSPQSSTELIFPSVLSLISVVTISYSNHSCSLTFYPYCSSRRFLLLVFLFSLIWISFWITVWLLLMSACHVVLFLHNILQILLLSCRFHYL